MVKFIFNLIVSLFFGSKFTQNMSVVRLKESLYGSLFHHWKKKKYVIENFCLTIASLRRTT